MSADSQAWTALRSAYFYLREWDEADQVIAEARKQSPGFALEATHWLGLGYLERALAEAERLITVEPGTGMGPQDSL